MLLFIAFTTFLAIFIQWLVFLFTRSPKTPPGPFPIPILGSLWYFIPHLKNCHAAFEKLEKDYGGVVTIYSGLAKGGKIVLALNWDSVNMFVKGKTGELIANRPDMLSNLRGVGMTWADYSIAKDRKAFVVKAFRDLGLSNGSNPLIGDEIVNMIEAIGNQCNKAISPDKIITEAVSSSIFLSIFGHRLDFSDKRFGKLFELATIFFEGNMFEFFLIPYLKFVKPILGNKVAEAEYQMGCILKEWLEEQRVERQKSQVTPENARDVLDFYLAANPGLKEIEPSYVRMNVDMFVGSMDTASKSIAWILYYLAHMPEEQERLWKEMECNGCPQYPKYADKSKYPMLEAVIHESARYSSMVLCGFPRLAADTVEFGSHLEYQLEKGDTVFLSGHNSQFDANYWLDPSNFRINRWIDPITGNFKNHSHMLHFGIGRRVCPGEYVGRSLVFEFTGALIKHFQWKLDGSSDFNGASVKLTRVPFSHKLLFSHREK